MILLNGKSSDDFNLVTKTVSYPLKASNKIRSIDILGKDGAYQIKGELNNKILAISFTHMHNSIETRKKVSRNITKWLSDATELVLDYEPNKKWIIKDIIADSEIIKSNIDTFEVTFIVHPIQYAITQLAPAIAWKDIKKPWSECNIPWNRVLDSPKTFTITGDTQIILKNNGTYKALPKLIFEGKADVVVIKWNDGGYGEWMRLTNLEGTTTVDCDLMIVYKEVDNSKINFRNNFDGNYLNVEVGRNVFNISGTNMNLVLNFKYDDSFI